MINIPITSTFKKDGFNKAETSTSNLTKAFKRLALTLGTALSARKIAQFTKTSIKAFLEEDKAIQVLSNNLQNLGLAYDIRPIEKYIREMQYATGVADSELRPAYQKLANATKNLSATQDILGLALDISAGTGKSLSAVTDALSRAYLGNNTSLSRLNLGIKKADLASKSFSEITGDLTKQFSGSAAKAANTYAGKLNIIQAAASDAQEIIGGKLIQSMEILAGKNTDITKLAESFETLATNLGDVFIGYSTLLEKIKGFGGLGGEDGLSLQGFKPKIPGLGIFRLILGLGRKKAASDEAKQNALINALAKERGMLASKFLKTQKKITKELTDQEKLAIAQKKLAKAGSMLDLEKIQIEAALQGELTDNEKLRLQLMKALVNENATRAEMLAGKLKESQTELAKLSNQTFNFKAPSPFDEWEDAILRMQRMLAGLSVPSLNGGSISGGQAGGAGAGAGADGIEILATPKDGPELIPSLASGDLRELTATEQNIFNVQLTVEGSVITQQDLEKVIVDTVVKASTDGYSTGWYRTTGLLSAI
jgi:hypothetical protein